MIIVFLKKVIIGLIKNEPVMLQQEFGIVLVLYIYLYIYYIGVYGNISSCNNSVPIKRNFPQS